MKVLRIDHVDVSMSTIAAVEAKRLVLAAGGRVVEWSIDAGYPALFFEDPAGIRLEVCAHRPRA
jgi:hypothetical protein